MARIGILALGRPTFDVPFAEEKLTAMLARLERTEHDIVGPRQLLFDGPSTDFALDELIAAGVDQILVLQVTFTDAVSVMKVAESFAGPLSIWAIPEPRLGGRLRLNAFCGLNLASHSLARMARPFGWLYADPSDADLEGLLSGARAAGSVMAKLPEGKPSDEGAAIAARLKGRKLGRIGAAPDGFTTCAYDGAALKRLAGVEVEELPLPDLFDAARTALEADVAEIRSAASEVLEGLDEVDQDELDRSLRLKHALDKIRSDRGLDAFAIRCWPETFTEYGGAVCGPVSMLGEARVPCACEADVYGAVTQLLLQDVADAPVFLVDIVDMDIADESAVVWHCGQAPLSMADPEARPSATLHTNRKMPLLYEFPLRPGPVTLVRLSQASGTPVMVLAEGEMLRRPMAFTGTSGVLRFQRPIAEVLDTVIASGLEHHMALAYGQHSARLKDAARALDVPVLEL